MPAGRGRRPPRPEVELRVLGMAGSLSVPPDRGSDMRPSAGRGRMAADVDAARVPPGRRVAGSGPDGGRLPGEPPAGRNGAGA